MAHDMHQTGAGMVFLVGCPRSGTTWLQRLLAAHPRIKTGPESGLFKYIGPQYQMWREELSAIRESRGGVGLGSYMSEEEFLAIQGEYARKLVAAMLRDVRSGDWFLEKSPIHSLYLPEILALLPQAKFIHLARDPRAVTASLLAASRGWAKSWAPRRAGRAVRIWWQHVSAVRQAAAKLSPAQYLEIHYEDLHADPAKILRQVTDFLGAGWPEADLLAAIKANAPEELRQGRGTQIPVGGEYFQHRDRIAFNPEFVRWAQPDAWRRELTWCQRWQMNRALRRIGPEWKRYAKS